MPFRRRYRPDRDPDKITRFEYLGRVLDIPETVQPIFPVSHLLGEACWRRCARATGCSTWGPAAASTPSSPPSKSAEVIAVDVNLDALRAARHNAELNGVDDRIEIFESDVFEHVDGAFDLIVFDPPFRWFAPRDMAERATTDEDYRALTTFFERVHAHLTANGRLLVFFGSSGDVDYLRH